MSHLVIFEPSITSGVQTPAPPRCAPIERFFISKQSDSGFGTCFAKLVHRGATPEVAGKVYDRTAGQEVAQTAGPKAGRPVSAGRCVGTPSLYG